MAEATRERESSTGRSRVAAHGSRALSLLAAAIDIVVAIVAILMLGGILFVVLKANPHNGIVNFFHDAAKWLAGPFDGMFNIKDHKAEIAVNWGIALAVYVIVGRALASLLRRG
jgi:hypothetical protein